jgi:deoxyribodipyrimidine photo-lyase
MKVPHNNFPTAIENIMERVEAIAPDRYARSRNFIDGAVTYLSPYISRGVITTAMLKEVAEKKGFKQYQLEKFIQELAWREYWQRIWQNKGDAILWDLKHEQKDVQHQQIPAAIVNAATGIEAIDSLIEKLYNTGYMHNHVRMYVAGITCNMAKAHWLLPAQWLYYHLLDGDVASNHLSWQWVAGSFSSKKYYSNQQNINRYTHHQQTNTFLDHSYETLVNMPVPQVLANKLSPALTTTLPVGSSLKIDTSKPACIYNSYNLDPFWRKEENVNRVLLLEPSHFKKYPVSENVIDFIIALSKNIEGLQIHTGEFTEVLNLYNNSSKIIYKEHPAFTHYKGTCDSRTWMAPGVSNNLSSFFSFYKKAKKEF